MSATLLGFFSAMLSAMCLLLLAASDSKRAQPRPALSLPSRLRSLLVAAAVVPGVLFAVTGRWVAFLIWLGIAAMLGWMIAALFSALSAPKSRNDSDQQVVDRN
jgi:membrane protein implicated in regulation of membrane protease activity